MHHDRGINVVYHVVQRGPGKKNGGMRSRATTPMRHCSCTSEIKHWFSAERFFGFQAGLFFDKKN